MPQTERIPIKGPAYLTLLAGAARTEQQIVEELRSEGWVWDPDLRQYTHPDKPGASIIF